MMKKTRSYLWALVPTALWGQMLLPLAAWGQAITPDGTLPTQVIQNGDDYRIEGGARAGGNLFHSFQEFSVPTGGEAFFNNAADVDNILSRVTGGNISNIDGLLGAYGSANLFLINPAGIVFGPNARLDIGGSFLGSTASGMLFPDGTEFNATNQSTPLLTINAPIGLQFRGDEGNVVVNQSQVLDSNGVFSVGLEVQSGRTLGLVGGDVSLDGGRLTAPGGRVELGGLAAAGTVGLNDDGSLSFPDGVARGNVSFANEAFVGTSANISGSIVLNAQNIELRNSSLSSDSPFFSDSFTRTGNIMLNATGEIYLANSSIEVQGDKGVINIQANSMFSTSSSLSASELDGVGGDISIKVDNYIWFKKSTIVSFAGFGVSGGNIDMDASSIVLDRSILNVNATFGIAGNINLNASDTISISGRSGRINSNADGFLIGTGRSGEINITAREVTLSNGATVEVIAYNGNAGNIDIQAGSFSMTEGAQIRSSTRGKGNAGNITINVVDIVSFDGTDSDGSASGAFSRVEEGRVDEESVGAGGNIDITARSLSVTNGAQLDASTFGQGNAGSVIINATETVSFDGAGSSDGSASGAFSRVEAGAVGTGGNIDITARSLSLSNGAELTTSSFGEGDAGNLTVNTSGRIELRNNSTISTDATGIAGGGNISISTEEFLIAFPEGDNDITANAERGKGGEVEIKADGLLGIDFRERPNSRTNDITASSESGPQGNVTFNTPNADIIQGLVELSENVVDTEALVAQACRPNRTGGSSLIETGRGGLPPTPYEPLTDDTIRVGGQVAPPRLADLPDPEQVVTKVERTEEITSDDIQPARGWFVNEKGNVVLTPYPTPNTAPRHPRAPAGCGPANSD